MKFLFLFLIHNVEIVFCFWFVHGHGNYCFSAILHSISRKLLKCVTVCARRFYTWKKATKILHIIPLSLYPWGKAGGGGGHDLQLCGFMLRAVCAKILHIVRSMNIIWVDKVFSFLMNFYFLYSYSFNCCKALSFGKGNS